MRRPGADLEEKHEPLGRHLPTPPQTREKKRNEVRLLLTNAAIEKRTFDPQFIQWGMCAVEPQDHGETYGAIFSGVVLQHQKHFRHPAPPLADNHWL